jgi:o-succinylbenzoate---CoA ligase
VTRDGESEIHGEALAALERGALDVFAAARDEPERVALVERGVELSHGELAAEVSLELHGWQGLPKGAPVAFVAHGDRRSVVRLMAALASGRTALPLHPKLPEAVRLGLVAKLEGAVSLEDAVSRSGGNASVGQPPERGTVALDPESIALCLATSGSTGAPKLVRLSRRALAASALASEANLGWRDDDRWLVAMPLGHAGGVSIVTRCLAARRAVALHAGFDAARVLHAIEAEGLTLLSVVPTMLAALLDADHRGLLAKLRAVLVGGAACPPALLAGARSRGVPVLATYGLTEAASQVTTQPISGARDPARAQGDSGLPLAGFQLRITADGAPCPTGESGRIEIRGPALHSGYVGESPHEASQWFATSDLGRLDAEGRLEVLGRSDDVIVTGGENVHPLRIEGVLASAASVAATLAFGVPDERWGELVALVVVLRDGASEREALEEIAALADAGLAVFERPRRVAIVEALPVSATGKPDRRRAKRELARMVREIGY